MSKDLTRELKQLRAEKKQLEEQLEIARNRANKTKTLKVRTETTKAANSFHISVNEIFTDAEAIKAENEDLFLSYDADANEYVFKTELRARLKDVLKKAVQK